MMRVISSPSSSTTGFVTLIFAIRRRVAIGAETVRARAARLSARAGL